LRRFGEGLVTRIAIKFGVARRDVLRSRHVECRRREPGVYCFPNQWVTPSGQKSRFSFPLPIDPVAAAQARGDTAGALSMNNGPRALAKKRRPELRGQ